MKASIGYIDLYFTPQVGVRFFFFTIELFYLGLLQVLAAIPA